MKVQSYNSKFKIILLILSSLTFNFGLLIFNLPKAHAQGLSLSISPPLLEILIKPGKSITQVYKIANNGEAVIVTPRLVEMTEGGIKEDANFIPEKWINLANLDLAFGRPFLLLPGQEKQLILRVNPPAGTPEHDYYRLILITTNPNQPGETSSSLVSETIGTPLIISVSATGLLSKTAKITKFVLPTFIDSFGPLETLVEVENHGNTYFHPVGKLILSGPIGRGTFDIVPNIILSGQKRILQTENNPRSSLSLSGFFLGKYRLEIDFTLDQGKTRINQVKTFYALPFKLIGASLLLAIFVFIMLKRRKTKSKRKR